MMFKHIVSNENILGGKPCIKNTRLSVEFILELIESGASFSEIMKRYPQLIEDQIIEAVKYARHAIENEIIIETDTVV